MSTTFTIKDVAAKVRELAAEYPDQLAACHYFYTDWMADDGKHLPCCIVGHAVAAFGWGPDDVREGDGASEVLERIIADGSEESTADWINWVQSKQDNGYSWAEAVKAADARVVEAGGEWVDGLVIS